MKVTSVNLETVCGITSKLPENDKLEVAFAGRSNVGKSSLINALMNRKSYARTSQQPGKTQTINFYNINELLYFVDLPGYGYAKVSQDTVKKWGKMIDGYLHQSKVLRLVFCWWIYGTNLIKMIYRCMNGVSIMDLIRSLLQLNRIRSSVHNCKNRSSRSKMRCR